MAVTLPGAPLRRLLLRNLVFGPLLLGVAVLAVLEIASLRMRSNVAAELTGRAISRVELSLGSYLRPVAEFADVSARLGRSGFFATRSVEDIDTVFGSLLASVPQISAIHLAAEDGREHMLMTRKDGSHFSRLSDASRPGQVTERAWSAGPLEGPPASVTTRASDYDTNDRVWFRGAVAALGSPGADPGRGDLVWSDPYTFFTTGEPGVTASVAYRTPGGGLEVLAFDILLRDVLGFVEDTRLGDDGFVMLLLKTQSDETLVALAAPRAQIGGDTTAFPISIDDLVGLPRALLASITDLDQGLEPERFLADGADWWSAVTRTPLSGDRQIWIAAAIPEDDVLAGIPDIGLYTILALAVTILLVTLRARVLAYRYGAPLAELAAETDRIGRLNFERMTSIDSPIAEVQQLASAQDEMRRSLGALTSMNDRSALVDEMMRPPSGMEDIVCGPYDIALRLATGRQQNGIYLMAFPSARDPSGTWVSGPEGPDAARVVILAEAALEGLRAAQQRPALTAIVRRALRDGTSGPGLVAEISEALHSDAGAIAPISICVAFVDPQGTCTSLVRSGDCGLVRVSRDQGTSVEFPFDHMDDDLTLAPDPGDILVMFSASFSQLLDDQRHVISLRELFSGLECDPSAPATEVSERILERLRHAHSDAVSSVSLGMVVITVPSSDPGGSSSGEGHTERLDNLQGK